MLGRLALLTGAILTGVALGGCSLSRFADRGEGFDTADLTGAIRAAHAEAATPTDGDLAFARAAASDVLTRGGKDVSQPWENPETGARGSVTPLATAYAEAGRTCRDFLASYVRGETERWLQGAACKNGRRWEIRSLKPWRRG